MAETRERHSILNPRRSAPEKAEERKAILLMDALGFTCWHLSQNRASRQTPGWPDMLFTHPGKGLAVYYEAKRQGGKQSPAQQEFQRHIEAAGGQYVTGTAQVLADWCVQKALMHTTVTGGLLIPRASA